MIKFCDAWKASKIVAVEIDKNSKEMSSVLLVSDILDWTSFASAYWFVIRNTDNRLQFQTVVFSCNGMMPVFNNCVTLWSSDKQNVNNPKSLIKKL